MYLLVKRKEDEKTLKTNLQTNMNTDNKGIITGTDPNDKHVISNGDIIQTGYNNITEIKDAVLGWADKNNLKMFIDQDKNNKKRVDKTIKFVNRHQMIGTNEINKERNARRNLIAIEEEEEKESEEKISKEKSEK